MRDLPIPGSPESSTTWPSPSLAQAQRSSRMPSSCSRPTSGVRCSPCSASKRPSARPSPSTRQAASGSAKPLSRCGPRSASSNRPPTRRRVAWLITTRARRGERLQPGRQIRRVADHRLAPAPRPAPISSPTMTRPVAMPTRAANGFFAARSLERTDEPPRPARARPAPPARPRPRAPAASRNRRARRRPCTWRRGRPSARPPRCRRLIGVGSPAPCPRDRAAPQARSSRPGRTNSTVSCRRSASVRLALGAASARRARGPRSRQPAKAAIAFEQLAPVTDGGDAKIFQIVSSQLRQDLGVDLILPERLLVALQPQLP